MDRRHILPNITELLERLSKLGTTTTYLGLPTVHTIEKRIEKQEVPRRCGSS
jgi:hypothetical protein